jgi:hypothetical protein
MRTSENTVDLLKALMAAHAAFKPIIKDSVGQVGSGRVYQYADLLSLLEATRPALLANDLVVIQLVDAETSSLVTRLAHSSGQFIESSYPLNFDQSSQALGSSITYGRRYSLMGLLNLAAEDDDGAAAQAGAAAAGASRSKKTISDAQVRRLWTVADKAGWSRDRVKAWLIETLHVSSSSEIPVAAYDRVIAYLERGDAPPDDQPF